MCKRTSSAGQEMHVSKGWPRSQVSQSSGAWPGTSGGGGTEPDLQMEGHSWDLCAGHRSAQRGRKWIKVRSSEAGRTLAQR